MAFFFEQWKNKSKDTKEWVTIDGRPVFVGGPGGGGGSSSGMSGMPKPSGKGTLIANVQAQSTKLGSGIYAGDENSVYNAEIYPDGIRIFGMAVGHETTELKPFDYTFKIGDPAFVTAGQEASRRGPIISIAKSGKTITVQNQPTNEYYNTNSRLNLYQFIYANAWGNDFRQRPRTRYSARG